ncbi:MAG: hypothetical protein AAFV29_19460, partial [Myxococcota bacterium]
DGVADAIQLDITLVSQVGDADCDDLTSIAATPNVDFDTQILPVLSGCVGCHFPDSPTGSGLDLTPDNAYVSLVDMPSTQVPSRVLVAPGNPDESYLLEKISCNRPQVGNRMPLGAPLALSQQALIRDWIVQGAESSNAAPDAGVNDGGQPQPRPNDDSSCRCAQSRSEPHLGWLLALTGLVAFGRRHRRADRNTDM